ncbi:MAG: rhodanese-like domain-containing protein [Gammaproteobacteria bacterium]|nr:rhodanese-like domain-containing protein [Gammaproteobacteria bacterium]
MNTSITPVELDAMLSDVTPVQIFDVRLKEDLAPVTHPVPGATWRDPARVREWSDEIDPKRPVVVFCVHGLRVSRGVREALAELGFVASILEGGIDAWQEHAGQTAGRSDTDRRQVGN